MRSGTIFRFLISLGTTGSSPRNGPPPPPVDEGVMVVAVFCGGLRSSCTVTEAPPSREGDSEEEDEEDESPSAPSSPESDEDEESDEESR